MSLKQRTISGLLWNTISNFATSGIVLIVGIVLARILSPKEFGLIGMTTIFIAVSVSFINSGFSQALIRKKECTQIDYSTVFFFNLTIGIVFFLVLFFTAPVISNFFKTPELKSIIRVLALLLIIDSTTIIQSAILTKRIDFKLQTRISIIAASGSGLIAIIMAYNGFGVWSLVAQALLREALNSLLLWLWNMWRPDLIFNKRSFIELFGFGSKLLISGLIDTIYNNIYFMIIGKYFTAQELGYYTRARNFSAFPSENISGIVTRVSYPVLSELQDDDITLKNVYKRIIKSEMLVTFVLMLGLAAVAEPMIITLIGEKWRNSVLYLQMLCIAGMLYPLQALNLNILKVKGRSDIFLKLEIIKKILAVPVIIIGVLFGIKIMITGMVVNSFVSYYLNSYWSGKFISYSLKEQLKDIIPSFILAAGMALIVFLIGDFLPASYPVKLIMQVIAGALIVISTCELTKMQDYLYLKGVVYEKFQMRRKV